MHLVGTSRNMASWFANPQYVGHYAEYESTSKIILCTNGDLLFPQDAKQRDTYLRFLENCKKIKKVPSQPDFWMGTDVHHGRNFESISEIISSNFGSKAVIYEYDHPKKIYEEMLQPLVSMASSIVYSDPYLSQNFVYSPKHWEKNPKSERVEFLRMVLNTNQKANLRLVTASWGIPSNEVWQESKIKLKFLIDETKFRGSAQMTARQWPHGRWLRLGFPGQLFLTWEPSFSIDYWDRDKFGIQHQITFQSGGRPDSLLDRLLAIDSALDRKFKPFSTH